MKADKTRNRKGLPKLSKMSRDEIMDAQFHRILQRLKEYDEKDALMTAQGLDTLAFDKPLSSQVESGDTHFRTYCEYCIKFSLDSDQHAICIDREISPWSATKYQIFVSSSSSHAPRSSTNILKKARSWQTQ
jgi:hypothetical protein